MEMWDFHPRGITRTYRPYSGGSIGCVWTDSRSRLPWKVYGTEEIVEVLIIIEKRTNAFRES